MLKNSNEVYLNDIFSKNVSNELKNHIEDVDVNVNAYSSDDASIDKIDHNNISVYDVEVSWRKLKIGKIHIGRILTLVISLNISVIVIYYFI